jgi:hypothetical protein
MRLQSFSLLAVGFAAVFGGQVAKAGVTACATTANGNALSTYASATTNTPPLGCGNIDLGFSNFTAGGTLYNSTGAATTFTTALADIYSPTATGPTGNTQGPISNDFDVPGTPTWSLISGSGQNGPTTSDVAYTLNVLNGTSGVTEPTSTGFVWAVNTIGLSATATVPAVTGNTVVITEIVCIDSNSIAGCSAAHTAELIETFSSTGHTFTDANLGSSFTFNATNGTLTVNAGFVTAAIEDEVVLTRTGGNTVSLTTLSNTFDQFAEAPEPSTFVLFGGALAGLLALQKRRSILR